MRKKTTSCIDNLFFLSKSYFMYNQITDFDDIPYHFLDGTDLVCLLYIYMSAHKMRSILEKYLPLPSSPSSLEILK